MKALRTLCLVLACSASPLAAEDDTDWARDFRIIYDRNEACVQEARTYAEAAACGGKATQECLGEVGEWPYPEPRNCDPRRNSWEAIYQDELMLQLSAADFLDRQGFALDTVTVSGVLRSAIEAELAWSSYASGLCRVESLALAELTYDERQALPQTFCMERQYAKHIFYLRSERNWLNHYRKPKGD